ncbi:MAG TPA: caspase family protein, partial [Gemmataceae bacterium]|nr:caspase family protein [Gemmataceae bacterium]
MKTFFRIPKTLLIAAAVVALMSGAAAQARAEGNTPNLHYVSVGVSKMPLAGPKHQLPYPDKDAKDLAKVWEAQKGKLYENVNGEVLTNETATLAQILASLDRLTAHAKAGDTAVVSLAGHGGFDKILNQWIFVPSDHDPKNFDATVLTQTQICDRLAQLAARGVTVILVLDTCQAGAFSSGDSGIVVLGGCTATQSGTDDHRIANGFFTYALIEALNGKAD